MDLGEKLEEFVDNIHLNFILNEIFYPEITRLAYKLAIVSGAYGTYEFDSTALKVASGTVGLLGLVGEVARIYFYSWTNEREIKGRRELAERQARRRDGLAEKSDIPEIDNL